MRIVILAEILFVCPSHLLAYIAVTFLFDTYSDGADLLDGAGLAGIAIGTARCAALGIGALPL